MATYTIFKAAGLFREADFTSVRLGTVPIDTTFVGTPQGNGFIKARIPSVSADEGFLFEDGHAEELIVAPVSIHSRDVGTLCALVTRAARDMSTDRDYLLAVAYDQTKNLSEMADTEGKKVGPFRYTEEEWSAAIQNPRLREEVLQVQDRFLWYRQAIVAAAAASDAVAQFKSAFARLPKFKELYFYQLVGADALNALRTPERLCREVLTESPPAGSYAAGLRSGSQTVNEATAELQLRLQNAYAEALKVIDLQPPEIRFFRSAAGEPPWMAVAREQMSAGVSEDTSLRNSAQINAYFTTIGATPGPTTPWCGAFVGYCVKKCGVDAIASTVEPAATSTAFWQNKWGQKAEKPFPIGSIVVLKPRDSDGHVGFVAEGSTDEVICLLGGNQGGGNGPDRVGIVKFPVASNPILAVKSMAFDVPDAGIAAGSDSAIAWGAVVSPEFKQKVIQISSFLGCDPNHLMSAMAFETGETFRPDIKNPRSGATGLIQFTPPAAQDIGTTLEALARMTALEQLDFVLKHFLRHKGKVGKISDVYMAIFRPASVGAPEGSALYVKPSREYEQNAELDTNNNGVITKEEATSKVIAKLQRGLTSGFKG